MNAVIYAIVWLNKYFYIGQTQNFKKRKSKHLYRFRKNNHSNKKMQNVFNKYDEPIFHIVEECEIEELNEREQFYFNLLFDDPKCLNLSSCAEATRRGMKTSEDVKKRLSILNKGKKHSEETKIKLSKITKGKNHPLFGKKHSEETKKKISKSRKGKTKGENHHYFGKKQSEEVKRKIYENHKSKKEIYQFSKDGKLIKEWDSISNAARSLNIYVQNISACLLGQNKSSGGFVWKYKGEEV